jgi:hypothetical protein
MEELPLPEKWIGMDIIEKWNWLLDKRNGLFMDNEKGREE